MLFSYDICCLFYMHVRAGVDELVGEQADREQVDGEQVDGEQADAEQADAEQADPSITDAGRINYCTFNRDTNV